MNYIEFDIENIRLITWHLGYEKPQNNQPTPTFQAQTQTQTQSTIIIFRFQSKQAKISSILKKNIPPPQFLLIRYQSQ